METPSPEISYEEVLFTALVNERKHLKVKRKLKKIL
jgi:hypothetical protein